MSKEVKYDMMPEILKGYVKNDQGVIYHVIKHKVHKHKCYLRTRNKFVEAHINDIRQLMVSGGWSSINEHEWRNWVKEDNAYIENMSQKLIKRTMVAQLLLEVNDELIQDNEDNKYLRNKLEKSNRECERIVKKNYDTIYGADENLVQNVMNKIDELTTNLSKLNAVELMDINAMVGKYIEDPEKYRSRAIEMEKIED